MVEDVKVNEVLVRILQSTTGRYKKAAIKTLYIPVHLCGRELRRE